MKNEENKQKYIFTFWEPKSKIPDYITLCIKTWEKFIPDYQIIILDYSNIDKWLGKKIFDNTLYKYYSLPKQADAIRCAILMKYGGIWFDADTIITSDRINHLLDIKSKFVLINKHIAFIKAEKNSYILNKWFYSIRQRLFIYKCCNIKLLRKLFRLDNWDYLGNGILEKLLNNAKQDEFYSIDRKAIYALPEVTFYPNENPVEAYQKFYFQENHSKYILDNSKYIILLHNSWTPEIYKRMQTQEFLKQDNTLAQILKNIGTRDNNEY